MKTRKSFGNLLLLCHPHHTLVDRTDPMAFPPTTLRKWKESREASGEAALSGLRNVTEERLQEVMSEAMKASASRVENALTRFQEYDSEAASALRDLLDELDQTKRRPLLDPGDVDRLYQAASLLEATVDLSVFSKLAHALENFDPDDIRRY